MIIRLDGLPELEAAGDPEEIHLLSSALQTLIARVSTGIRGYSRSQSRYQHRRSVRPAGCVRQRSNARGAGSADAAGAAGWLNAGKTAGFAVTYRYRAGPGAQRWRGVSAHGSSAADCPCAGTARHRPIDRPFRRTAPYFRRAGRCGALHRRANRRNDLDADVTATGDASRGAFVGRHPELAMILAAIDRCATTRRGRAVVLRGDAGMGKTRLADAIRQAAAERGVATHSAQVFDFGQSPGRRPVAQLALSLLDLPQDAAGQCSAARQ